MAGKEWVVRNNKRGAQVRKARAGTWTAAKQQAFLSELAATCNVSRSVRSVGMGEASVYALRQRDPGFRAAWGKALDAGYEKLEAVLLERAVNGTAQPLRLPDGSMGEKIMYSDAVALKLLKMHRGAVAEERAQHSGGRDPDEVLAEIRERLAEIEAKAGAGPRTA